MTSSKYSGTPHGIASLEQTINPGLLTTFFLRDSSSLAAQSIMNKREGDCESAADPKLAAVQPKIRKRKNHREKSADSPSQRSETPTRGGKRPNKIPKSTRPASSAHPNATAKPKGEAKGKTPETEDTTVAQSSLADSVKSHPDTAAPESPPCTFLDFLDGLPHPSATQVAAAHSSSCNPVSRPYLSAVTLNYSNPHSLNASHQQTTSTPVGQAMGWRNSSNSQGKATVRYNPSPLGQATNHPGDTHPLTDQQNQAVMRQQMMSRLYHDSQMHQHWQLMAKQTAKVQREQENEDQKRDYFVYGNEIFTLGECLLACALKSFCRSLGDQPGEGPSDDTVAEIIQHQRGWRNPNGLDCGGLCVTLIRYGSVTRGHIEQFIQADRHKWEEDAWSAYWSWMGTMKELYTRMVAEGHMDGKTGQIPGSGFDGNVHEAQKLDGDSNALHQHGTNPFILSTSAALDSQFLPQDEASQHGMSQTYTGQPIIQAVLEDDIFGFE